MGQGPGAGLRPKIAIIGIRGRMLKKPYGIFNMRVDKANGYGRVGI